MSIMESAKVVGNILKDNKDTIAQVGKVGVSEVVRHKGKSDAKERYADYLAFKSSGETDIEKFAYERSQTSGRDWSDICENIRFHVDKSGAPTQSNPVSQPAISDARTIAVKAAQLTHTKEFMNAAGMLEMFDSPSLTKDDTVVMFQVICDDLTRRQAISELRDWEALRDVFDEFVRCGVRFAEYFKPYSVTFRKVYDVYDKPIREATTASVPNVDMQTAWKSIEIARFIRLPQNNGRHLTQEDWLSLHSSCLDMLRQRNAPEAIISIWASLRDKWEQISSPVQDSIDLVAKEVGVMQEVYNYVQIPGYGTPIEDVSEQLFSMFPAIESADFRRVENLPDAAVLFALKKLRELI